MNDYLVTLCLACACSFLWRIRGGLDIWKGGNVPFNKIWFALFVGFFSMFSKDAGIEHFANVSIATYVAHQLFGWGLYIGTLVGDGHKIDPEKDKENQLIDELILPLHITIKGQKFYLYQFPKWYGFAGTTITGLMITYLMGLALGSFWFGFSGVGMGICYWLGSMIDHIKPDGKSGWNWGEWIFGFYIGVCL